MGAEGAAAGALEGEVQVVVGAAEGDREDRLCLSVLVHPVAAGRLLHHTAVGEVDQQLSQLANPSLVASREVVIGIKSSAHRAYSTHLRFEF